MRITLLDHETWRTVAALKIYHGSALPFGYGLPVSEGDRFEFGKLVLNVPKTPGHPDECISLVFADTAVSEGSNDP